MWSVREEKKMCPRGMRECFTRAKRERDLCVGINFSRSENSAGKMVEIEAWYLNN